MPTVTLWVSEFDTIPLSNDGFFLYAIIAYVNVGKEIVDSPKELKR